MTVRTFNIAFALYVAGMILAVYTVPGTGGATICVGMACVMIVLTLLGVFDGR